MIYLFGLYDKKKNTLYENIYQNMLTREMLQDLQRWTSDLFCQSGTSSLTSVTSYFSHLLDNNEGSGKGRQEMLIREQKSVVFRMPL